MRGSIRKRCQCRDEHGQEVKGCRKAHGSWAYVIDAGINATTGKRQQIRRSKFRTREEAQDAMVEALNALNTGAWTDDKGITVAAWLDQWLVELGERDRSPKTLANYSGHVRDVWKPELGRLKLRDLRRAHIEKVLAGLGRAEPVGDRPKGNIGRRIIKRTPATIDGYRRTLRSALSAAERRGLIAINPAKGQMDSIPDTRARRELTIWEPAQTARFLRHVEGDRLEALYEVAAYCGLRRAELCGIRWDDLDADGAGLSVRQTVVEVARSQTTAAQRVCPVCAAEHVSRFIKRPKSRAGTRWVPVAASARRALAEHRARQREERDQFGPDYNDHGLVFCGVDGTPLRPSAVTVAFEAHRAAAGLPRTRLHDTRHGACSLMLSGGVPIEVVQMIMGHSSPAVTRLIYAHVLREETAKQVEAATDLLTRYRRDQSVTNSGESAVDGTAGPEEDGTGQASKEGAR